MMSYLYGEWRIREKERKAKARREFISIAILEIVGFVKDSAIFYNHQWRKASNLRIVFISHASPFSIATASACTGRLCKRDCFRLSFLQYIPK